MTAPILRLELNNGLLVLLKEIHTAPIISHWLWYRVGSRLEPAGLTGISHWIEHMLFKGTPQFPAGVSDRAIAREGGVWNAFTFLDWTTYYETLPADKIDLALRLEADRMVNTVFDPADVESERTVILSERQGEENSPLFRLSEQVQAAAFHVHPYRHEIIGDVADLQSIQRDDLYAYYQHHYLPNNAVLTVAGDFESNVLVESIRVLYEPIPAGELASQQLPLEPSQVEEQRLTVEGPGETVFLQVAYHAPAGPDPDFSALNVLDSLLSGPTNLNIFDGGISNKTSRLYHALVEKELAVGVNGGVQATIDPYLYTLLVTVRPGQTADACLAALDAQVARLQEAPPHTDELQRAVKQARALFAYGSESISNQAFWMGFSEMFDHYDWFTSYLERLEAVTPVDVQRLAQTSLRPNNRTVGVYRPTGRGSDAI